MDRKKLSPIDRLFTEENLRNYKFYKFKLEQERQNIIHATPIYDNNGGGKSNLPSRPTEKIAMSLVENSEKWKIRLQYMTAIEFALGELSEERQRFILSLYCSGERDNQAMYTEFKIGKSTFQRWVVGWVSDFLYRVWELAKDD